MSFYLRPVFGGFLINRFSPAVYFLLPGLLLMVPRALEWAGPRRPGPRPRRCRQLAPPWPGLAQKPILGLGPSSEMEGRSRGKGVGGLEVCNQRGPVLTLGSTFSVLTVTATSDS